MREKRSQIKIKGENCKEKFAHLETILRRMARRMNEKVVGIMPPSVIFHYVKKPELDGTILKCFLPSGEITKICLAIKKYNTKKAVRFICNLETKLGTGRQYVFETHKEVLIEDINLSVEDVSFFTLMIDQSDVESPGISAPLVEDIWATALFQFERSESQIKMFMLDELEKLEDLSEGV